MTSVQTGGPLHLYIDKRPSVPLYRQEALCTSVQSGGPLDLCTDRRPFVPPFRRKALRTYVLLYSQEALCTSVPIRKETLLSVQTNCPLYRSIYRRPSMYPIYKTLYSQDTLRIPLLLYSQVALCTSVPLHSQETICTSVQTRGPPYLYTDRRPSVPLYRPEDSLELCIVRRLSGPIYRQEALRTSVR